MTTLHLGEEYNKRLGITQKVRHFSTAYQMELRSFLKDLAESAEPGTVLDIGDCRFDSAAGSEISAAIFSYDTIKIIDSARPFNNYLLEENYVRKKAQRSSCPNVLEMPENCTDSKELLLYARNIDRSKPWVISEGYYSSFSKIEAYEYYIILVLLFGEIDLNVKTRFDSILHKVHSHIEFDADCKDWYIKYKAGVLLITPNSDGLYDLGPDGLCDSQTLFSRYQAVPSYFGRKSLGMEWTNLLRKCLSCILLNTTEVKKKTLYDIIESRSEKDDDTT